jgi:phosphohistidine phosphatase
MASPSSSAARDSAAPALRVLLIRHGKAERHSATGFDEDRHLKPRGERQASWLAGKIVKAKSLPTLLLHSPLARAVETSRPLVKALKCKFEKADELAVGIKHHKVLELIKEHRGSKCIALVGHNPQLEEVAAALVTKLGTKGVDLRTGEALVIDIPADKPLAAGTLVERWRIDEEVD